MMAAAVFVLRLSLLSMSTSDEDEAGAIQRAQAVARAWVAAQLELLQSSVLLEVVA